MAAMYRDPSSSMAQTITRLESEVCDLRALGARRREHKLIVVSLLSVLFGVFAGVACFDARQRESWLETQLRIRQEHANRCVEHPTERTLDDDPAAAITVTIDSRSSER